MLRVVFDSNVYISAVLFDGPPRQILNAARQKKIVLVSSDEIINETARKLKEKFLWPEFRVEQFVDQISKVAEISSTKEKIKVIADDADNRILECAIAGSANIIISGDNHLLKLKVYKNIPIKNSKYLTYLFN